MAHIHLEDGAFTPLWVLVWSLAAAGIIALVLFLARKEKIPPRRLALAAMAVSVGFAIFQVEVPPFGIHINLTPLIGILVGPGLGSIVVLLINVFSAAIGHGGWGMIGANTIVNIVEVMIGYYGYRLLRRQMKLGRFSSGFAATTVAMVLSAVLVVVIIVISEIQGSELTREETLDNLLVIAALNLVGAFIEGVITGYVVSFIGKVRPDMLKDAEGPCVPADPATTG